MSAEEMAAIDGVDPTPIHHPVDDEAIASAVNEAAAEVAMEAVMADGMRGEINDPTMTGILPPEGVKPATTEGAAEETPKTKKENKKRIRRVGKVAARKFAKLEDGTVEATEENAEPAAPLEFSEGIPRVVSKHDEKWNNMFEKLVAYKAQHDSTLVPQLYQGDVRLGRWCHYQRVEYWIYQQSGAGKITPERIARLEGIGFEWDPQRAQWNKMFSKLEAFRADMGHCKVPKGYTKDPELANWVRNQRLEHANLMKGKKSRMTDDRFKKLDEIGFRWSTAMPSKGGKKPGKKTAAAPKPTEKDAKTAAEEVAKTNAEEGTEKPAKEPQNGDQIVMEV